MYKIYYSYQCWLRKNTGKHTKKYMLQESVAGVYPGICQGGTLLQIFFQMLLKSQFRYIFNVQM